MTNMTMKLGNCKFCGSGSVYTSTENGGPWGDGPDEHCAKCDTCGARSGLFETKELAVLAWNSVPGKFMVAASTTTAARQANEALQARITELVNVCTELKADLLRRAETDSEGCKVVAVSAGVWEEFKRVMRKGGPQ